LAPPRQREKKKKEKKEDGSIWFVGAIVDMGAKWGRGGEKNVGAKLGFYHHGEKEGKRKKRIPNLHSHFYTPLRGPLTPGEAKRGGGGGGGGEGRPQAQQTLRSLRKKRRGRKSSSIQLLYDLQEGKGLHDSLVKPRKEKKKKKKRELGRNLHGQI